MGSCRQLIRLIEMTLWLCTLALSGVEWDKRYTCAIKWIVKTGVVHMHVGKVMLQQRTCADRGPVLSDLWILHRVTTVTDVSPEAKELLAHSLSLSVCLLLQLTGRKLGLGSSAQVQVGFKPRLEDGPRWTSLINTLKLLPRQYRIPIRF